MKARRIGIVLFFLAVACTAIWLLQEPLKVMTIQKVQVGDRVQSFKARTLGGQAVTVELTGRKTMLLFFKIDCPHCHRQLASTERLAQQFEDEDLQIIALARSDHKALHGHSYSFNVLIDQSQAMVGRFGRVMVPTVALVDEGGVIRHIRSGFQPYEKDRQTVEAFVNNGLNHQHRRSAALGHEAHEDIR